MLDPSLKMTDCTMDLTQDASWDPWSDTIFPNPYTALPEYPLLAQDNNGNEVLDPLIQNDCQNDNLESSARYAGRASLGKLFILVDVLVQQNTNTTSRQPCPGDHFCALHSTLGKSGEW